MNAEEERMRVVAQNGNDALHYAVVSGKCKGCGFDMSVQGSMSCSLEASTGYKMGYPSSTCCRGRMEASDG